MKKLVLLCLLLPCLSYGQRIFVSEQAGYGVYNSIINTNMQQSGFSNQVTVGCQFMKHFSAGVFYEYERWDAANNSFGVSADFVLKHFYAGLEVKEVNIAGTRVNGIDAYSTYKYDPSFGIGGHIGGKQKIFGHLSVTEQVGYGITALHGTHTFVNEFGPFVGITSNPMSESIKYAYVRVGLLYRI